MAFDWVCSLQYTKQFFGKTYLLLHNKTTSQLRMQIIHTHQGTKSIIWNRGTKFSLIFLLQSKHNSFTEKPDCMFPRKRASQPGISFREIEISKKDVIQQDSSCTTSKEDAIYFKTYCVWFAEQQSKQTNKRLCLNKQTNN